MIQKVDELRAFSLKLFQLGAVMGVPVGISRDFVVKTFKHERVPVPDDVLAFATGGQFSDVQVRDWSCPYAGE